MQIRKTKYFGLTDLICCILSIIRNDITKLEKKFAEYIGCKKSVATSYGRTALYLGLKAIGVEGKEVILPSFTCTVVRQAVLLAGATPRFVDIILPEMDFDLRDLKKKITTSTGAIVITHYFGGVASNLKEIIDLGKKKRIPIIEDCAHSLGAQYEGKKIGSYGDLSIFSLTKGLINFGGGMLVTDNDSIYSKVRKIMDKEEMNLKTRIADYPLILTYGLEQIIDKAIFDRIGKSFFKWWAIETPKMLLMPRKYLFLLANKITFLFKKTEDRIVVNEGVYSKKNKMKKDKPYSLGMSRIIASVGLNQLRRIEEIIEMRNKVCKTIKEKMPHVFITGWNKKIRYVDTNILFIFENCELEKVIDYFKGKGILLRGTWPTHQRLWEEQITESVMKLKNEVLTWNTNPMLTEKELENFGNAVTTSPFYK